MRSGGKTETVFNTTIPPLHLMNAAEQAYHLTRFVVEARKKDGNEYPANTLHHIITGIMRDLRWHGIHVDFFKDPEFADIRSTLDSEMKRIQASGIGSRPKQAEIILEEEEELLWQKGLLGDSSPQVLLDTMVFCCGLFFALRSGSEHRSLRHSPCQIQVFERHGERAYLEYTEDLSKNHPGGLKGCRVKQKIVRHHANTSHQERCFVRLFKRYRQLCPAGTPPHAFYLQALSDILNRPGPSDNSIELHSSSSSVPPNSNNTLSLASAQQHQHGIHLPSATFNNCNITFNATPMVGQTPDQTPPTKKRRAIIYDSDSD